MKSFFLITATAVSFLAAMQLSAAGMKSQDAATMLGAAYVKEISFDKNSFNLTGAQKIEIRETVNQAAEAGKIDQIKVLAWSDKEYPSKEGKQGRDDNKLAKNRMKELKLFLNEDLKVMTIKTYNMTQRPTALQKFFHTTSEKVKNTTEFAGAAPTAEDTGIFDSRAQASKGIIMIFMKK